jgi:hypothetical protein
MYPYRYADIRRLADFQNRVFETYARAHDLGWVDVAAVFPRKPRYFSDPIHSYPAGSRLRAWIVLQGLVPLVDAKLRSGEWPRPTRSSAGSHPVLDHEPTQRIDLDALALDCPPVPAKLTNARVVERKALGEWDWQTAPGASIEARPWGQVLQTDREIRCGPALTAIIPTGRAQRLRVRFQGRAVAGAARLEVSDARGRVLGWRALRGEESQSGGLEVPVPSNEQAQVVWAGGCRAGQDLRLRLTAMEIALLAP